MKIVINRKHGGFGLSTEAIERYIELKGITLYSHTSEYHTSYYTVPYEEYRRVHKNDMIKIEWQGKEEGRARYKDSNELSWSYYDIPRNDPALIQVVEEFANKANGWAAELKIVEVPNDVEWTVEEYDGMEWVAEKHRIWE